MILHGPNPSPFARKAIVVLEEKGIAYEQVMATPFPKTPELLKMHPMGKVPILETDDGTYIPDSSVICAYLERAHPEPALYPADPKDFARALFIEEYADTRIVESVGQIFFEKFVKPNVFKQDTDEEKVKDLLENQLPPTMDYLESQIAKGSETLLDTFSIADVALGAHLGGMRFAGMELDGDRWPGVVGYVEALWARPSFVKAMGGGTA